MGCQFHLTFHGFTILVVYFKRSNYSVYLPISTLSANYIILKYKFHCVVMVIVGGRISDYDHYVFRGQSIILITLEMYFFVLTREA